MIGRLQTIYLNKFILIIYKAGCVAGIVEHTIMFPLDNIKVYFAVNKFIFKIIFNIINNKDTYISNKRHVIFQNNKTHLLKWRLAKFL